MIGANDRAKLLEIARASIEAMLAERRYAPEIPRRGPLRENRGAFVTLTRRGHLRGCIGRIVSDEPLARVVAEMAIAAARDDYRFESVRTDELSEIHIEISALTPMRTLGDPLSEIEVGRHGLLIRRGSSSGLLLPQVAAGEGWSVACFLDETCRKAGLPAGAWNEEGAVVEAFEAEVWGEEESR